MKRKLKIVLCVSAFDVLVSSTTVVGLMRSQEILAAEQVSQQQPLSLAERRARLAREMTGEQFGPKTRTADPEACAQGVRADYSDEPERAYDVVPSLTNVFYLRCEGSGSSILPVSPRR